MKAKIDKDGFLNIERAGKFKLQLCPYDQEEGNCGDWCPLFVEFENIWDGKPYTEVKLKCGTAVHDLVSDERKATP